MPTKSGTNDFTGTVYGFYRNEEMTGSKIKGQSIFIPKLLQSQTGVSVGGPIIKNKLFSLPILSKIQEKILANHGCQTEALVVSMNPEF